MSIYANLYLIGHENFQGDLHSEKVKELISANYQVTECYCEFYTDIELSQREIHLSFIVFSCSFPETLWET